MDTKTKTTSNTNTDVKVGTNTGLSVRSLDDLPQNLKTDGMEQLCILGDTSGSMSAHYSEGKTRRQGLQEALNSLWEITDWGICATECLMFSDTYLRIPFESDSPPIVQNANHGGTNFEVALDAALVAKDRSRIILASDGASAYPELQIAKCQERGISIDTIFIGNDMEEDGALLLQRIASETGGVFTLCKNAHELAEQFQQLETSNRLALEYSPDSGDSVIKL